MGPVKGFSVSYGEYHLGSPRVFVDNGRPYCSNQRTHAAYFRFLPSLWSQHLRTDWEQKHARPPPEIPDNETIPFASFSIPAENVPGNTNAGNLESLEGWAKIKKYLESKGLPVSGIIFADVVTTSKTAKNMDLRAHETNPDIPLDELIFVEGEFHHLMLNCYIAARTCWTEDYGMGVRMGYMFRLCTPSHLPTQSVFCPCPWIQPS